MTDNKTNNGFEPKGKKLTKVDILWLVAVLLIFGGVLWTCAPS